MDQSPKTTVFTFGFGHTHPLTGESLANCYVVVPGDEETARAKMLAQFGNKWSFPYPTKEAAGVFKYNLTEIKWISSVKESTNADS